MPERRIPVSAPDLSGNEAAYVQECLASTWISSKGDFLERFEQGFADFCGARFAIACNNGTSALHLALLALGVGPGDEVIVPTLTYIASANAVRYCNATPRFVDILPDTWNIDPADVARKIGPRTKAIMPVHLFGVPAALDPLRELAGEHDLAIVEDAAEAHGARHQGHLVGPLGDVGTFSFYGNKIVTTGEGGMVVTNDLALRDVLRLYKGQGQDPGRSYWFPVVGFNYRMTNVQAAIGLAQMESVEAKLAARARVAERYRSRLDSRLTLQATSPGDVSANWMVVALLPGGGEAERDSVAALLAADGIETRPVFYPLHAQPPYLPHESDPGGYPVAIDAAARGLCLPTWGGLVDGDIDYVCDRLLAAVERVTA